MSNDLSGKPVGAPVAPPIVKPVPVAAKAAVPTELPAPKSVAATSRSVHANGIANAGDLPGQTDLAPKVMIDRASAEVVYRMVNTRTAEVVDQYPEESRLRARAYLRALDEVRFMNRQQPTDRRI